MQSNQTPTLVPLAFAAGGAFNTIPEASQIGTNPGGASLVDGFPPLTRTPIAAGGVPPSGLDMNGVLNLITQSTRWSHAGGRYGFSSTFAADTNVGGYPSGAMLMSADGQGTWLSLADNNSDNPDTGPGTKWAPSQAYGFSAISGLTNTNVTLTPAQAMKSRIVLTGALTGNVQVILPTWTREWTIVNNTTGNFSVTAKTASGSGIVVPAGASRVVGDGTNITQPAESIASATLSTHPLTAGQIGAIGSQGNLPINTSAKVNGVNAPNLLFNGSAEFGVAGGWSGGFVSAYNGGSGEGTYFSNPASINSNSYVGSNPIAISAGIQLTLSGEIYAVGVTSGIAWFRVVFLNSSSGVINTSSNILATNGAGWTFGSSSFTTPANTAYVYVQLGVESPGPNVSAGGVAYRRLKLERENAPSIYSQEANVSAIAGGMPVVGSVRNLSMSVATASASATLTADEIIVSSALGGVAYKLANFSKSINLATTGAGGMDTGSAPTSGSFAIYAIFNPMTGASALLAQNASTVRSNVYTGANMPSGYTASALVTVWGTNSSGQMNVGYARDRTVYSTSTQAFSMSTLQSSFTSVSVPNVPPNAVSVSGTILLTNGSSNNTPQGAIAASSTGIAEVDASATAVIVAGGISCPFSGMPIITPQTLYYKLSVVSSGTPNLVVNISSYTI
ncbi:hypothetical protein [Burkholderia cenocepacia]|uniref:hypothetical protein n=1 Tax=Burkholderia cenocepacia TaxID=95486 RepID=UPI0028741699|nr:hypothetical protein [Burkholderia cenocepacia]MDS0801702.1 hypothetical protein [Burkholderia cenocepacia]